MQKPFCHLGILLILSALAWSGSSGVEIAHAATPDVREVTIPFTQTDGTALRLSALEVVPEDGNRHPLVVISHGSPRKETDRPSMTPQRFMDIAIWFANHGYAVVVPMRRGYGHSEGQWAEGYGTCQDPHYDRAGLESARDIQAVVTHMRGQGFVDPQRIVLVGVSAGGWGSIAAASQNMQGVVAVVAFAPGRGSYAPDQVCVNSALIGAAHGFGSTAHVPLLWISADNDHFFPPTLARAMFDAFQSGSRTPAQFIAAPACGQDGHGLFARCPDEWHDTVATFLRQTLAR